MPSHPATSSAEISTERAEHRWAAVSAVVVALTLYALLPSEFLPPLRIAVIAACVALLVPLILINPLRLRRQTRTSRVLSLALTATLVIANHVALVQLVIALVAADSDSDGTLLLAAAQVWGTHVIAYALVYWELDRGGPVVRTSAPRKSLPRADIRFPQDADGAAVSEVARESSERTDWTANFIDYLYFSLANTMAFSPPDAVPLTGRIKAIVGLQAFAGYVVLVLVIARSVSLLG